MAHGVGVTPGRLLALLRGHLSVSPKPQLPCTVNPSMATPQQGSFTPRHITLRSVTGLSVVRALLRQERTNSPVCLVFTRPPISQREKLRPGVGSYDFSNYRSPHWSLADLRPATLTEWNLGLWLSLYQGGRIQELSLSSPEV